MNKLFLYFPQWQGTGGNEVYFGTKFLRENMSEFNFVEVPVVKNEKLELKNQMLGFDSIKSQLGKANELVLQNSPDRIFTVGGGCDVEIIPVGYLNKQCEGNIDVIWVDAHGDLNTPQSSPSGNFHGMPLRTLLGEGDREIITLVGKTLDAAQVVLVGTRDLDDPEQKYIEQNNIRKYDFSNFPIDSLKEEVYVHLDLDVLDPSEFGMVKVPTSGGVPKARLLEFLRMLSKNKKIVGGSVVEYTGASIEDANFVKDIISIFQG